MEYTKDLILNVNMKEARHKIEKTKWTSSILKHIKNYKTAFIATIALSLFIAIDIALLTGFVSLLTKI